MSITQEYFKMSIMALQRRWSSTRKAVKIPLRKGVRLGDTILYTLFTACLQEVFRIFYWEQMGVKVGGEYLSNFRLTDDIALLSYSGDESQSMIVM